MTYPTFRFCIHRTADDGEAWADIRDARAIVAEAAMARWRRVPFTRRITAAQIERRIAEAIEASFDDASRALVDRTIRL